MRSNSRKRRCGISAIELLAVVTILGIIAAIIVPRLTITKEAAATRIDNHNKAKINAAVERWYVEKGDWPQDDLHDIATDASYFPKGLPTHPATGRGYRLDPKSHRLQ